MQQPDVITVRHLVSFSDLVERLYSGCATVDSAGFRRWALQEVARVLPFDSGVWVIGGLDQGCLVTHDVYVHQQPAGFMENYSKVVHEDHLLEQLMCAPGQTVDLYDGVSREAWVAQEGYTGHCLIYGIEHAIATGILDPETRIFSFISLYRKDFTRPFSPREKVLKQLLTVHLVGAERLNRQLEIRRHRAGIDSRESFASCDSGGLLLYCERRFVELLHAVWPRWQGPSLPAELVKGADGRVPWSYHGSGYRFRTTPWGDGMMVFGRELGPLDMLSSRELEIARELATGSSYKQIARRLRISPSTVTNHVNAIYRKLDVTGKSQLAQILENG